MQKIIVIGSSGSGKSTFSRKLSRAMNIPVYHLDALFWKPNWHMRNLARKDRHSRCNTKTRKVDYRWELHGYIG
jgi:adenylate kinase family enzyme